MMIYFDSPSAFLEKMNQWFNGLIALPLLAVAFGYLEIKSQRFTGLVESNLYIDGAFVFLVLGVVIYGTRRYRKQISYIPVEIPLEERMVSYFLFSKGYYLLMFITALVSVSGMIVTGNTAYAGLYAFQLFLLSVHRPTLLSVANKLNLKGEQRHNFLKKDNFTLN